MPTSSSTPFNTIAHVTTTYYYVHVLRRIWSIHVETDDKVLQNFQDLRPKFFTMWGVAAQALLFALCVVHDATRLLPASNPLRRAARGLRDLFLVAVAGPIAVTVTAMFWGLFMLDRELVMPAVLDSVIPTWLNHAQHTFVLVLVLVQLLAEPHQPPPLGRALGLAVAVNAAYLYTFFNEYAMNDRWIYPIYDVLDWPGRIGLSAFTVMLFACQVVLMWALVRARWGDAKINGRGIKKRKD